MDRLDIPPLNLDGTVNDFWEPVISACLKHWNDKSFVPVYPQLEPLLNPSLSSEKIAAILCSVTFMPDVNSQRDDMGLSIKGVSYDVVSDQVGSKLMFTIIRDWAALVVLTLARNPQLPFEWVPKLLACPEVCHYVFMNMTMPLWLLEHPDLLAPSPEALEQSPCYFAVVCANCLGMPPLHEYEIFHFSALRRVFECLQLRQELQLEPRPFIRSAVVPWDREDSNWSYILGTSLVFLGDRKYVFGPDKGMVVPYAYWLEAISENLQAFSMEAPICATTEQYIWHAIRHYEDRAWDKRTTLPSIAPLVKSG